MSASHQNSPFLFNSFFSHKISIPFAILLSLSLSLALWRVHSSTCSCLEMRRIWNVEHTQCVRCFVVNDEAEPVCDRFQAQPNTNDYVNLVRYARVDVVRALSALRYNTNNNHSYQNRKRLLFELIINFCLTHSPIVMMQERVCVHRATRAWMFNVTFLERQRRRRRRPRAYGTTSEIEY